MLRIGRGIWRGQVLRPDLKGVRPTSSRVREALMSIISERLPGAVVWDLFSGSGAFGVECVSCGAEKAIFMDSSPVNLNRISKFFKEKDSISRCITVRGRLPEEFGRLVPPVDIVFMDPPYRESYIYSWILEFPWDSVVRNGGVVIVESGARNFDSPWQKRKYGDTHIHMLEVKK
ncbi:MAG: RsmD family RNA methyltransferase [Candidatus Sabulitectum sp.]|nr:RsmD family RNA methyltransferase [Candidatus Sabulitectum sp.]